VRQPHSSCRRNPTVRYTTPYRTLSCVGLLLPSHRKAVVSHGYSLASRILRRIHVAVGITRSKRTIWPARNGRLPGARLRLRRRESQRCSRRWLCRNLQVINHHQNWINYERMTYVRFTRCYRIVLRRQPGFEFGLPLAIRLFWFAIEPMIEPFDRLATLPRARNRNRNRTMLKEEK